MRYEGRTTPQLLAVFGLRREETSVRSHPRAPCYPQPNASRQCSDHPALRSGQSGERKHRNLQLPSGEDQD